MLNPKSIRVTLGLSKSEMARAMGVHYMTWYKWENGERVPDHAAVRLMAVLCLLSIRHPETFKDLLNENNQ